MLTLRNIDISPEILEKQGVISVESRTSNASSQYYPASVQYGFSYSLELTIKRLLGSWGGCPNHGFYPLIQLSENVYAKNVLIIDEEVSTDTEETSVNICVCIYDRDLVDTLDLYL